MYCSVNKLTFKSKTVTSLNVYTDVKKNRLIYTISFYKNVSYSSLVGISITKGDVTDMQNFKNILRINLKPEAEIWERI